MIFFLERLKAQFILHTRLSPELITQLETIRASNGNNPMTIHEGYRSVLWQRALTANGEPTAKIASPHTSGIAVDFHITGKDGNRISGKAIAETISGKTEGRVGIGSNWIHYDVGDMVYGPNYGLHTKNGTIYPYQKGSTWNY